MLFFIADQAPSTEIRPVPRPETRTTGVCPRRPQLRAFGGYSSCPDSSSKRIHLPAGAKQPLSPRLAAPGCDGVLVPLAARRAATCALNPRRCSRYETPRSVYVTPNRRTIIAATRGDAVISWPEVADSLVRHRASHLIVGVDAVLDPAVLGPCAQAALDWPSPQMLVERAVEQAVISDAEVTVLPADTPELVRAGGACAILRY